MAVFSDEDSSTSDLMSSFQQFCGQGEISNILYEDVTLHNASSAIQVSANYGSWAVSSP